MAKVTESGTSTTAGPQRPAGNALIYEDIEASASTTHGPNFYANLLSFFPNLQLTQDSLSEQFIPLTAVKDGRTRGGGKPFIIGILPPSTNVTGRLLDRSASIAEETQLSVAEVGGARLEDVAGELGGDLGQTPPANRPTKGDVLRGWGAGANTLDEEFWQDFVSMCERLGVDPVEVAAVMYTESGLSPSCAASSSKNPESNARAKGLIQNLRGTYVPKYMTVEEWERYEDLPASDQIYFIEGFLSRLHIRGMKSAEIHVKVFGGVGSNPNGILYAGQDYQERYISTLMGQNQDKYNAGGYGPVGSPEADAALLADQQKAAKTFQSAQLQADAYDINPLDRNKKGYIDATDFVGLDRLPWPYIQAIEAAKASGIRTGKGDNPFRGSAGARKPWVNDGSPAAQEILKQLARVARTGLNGTGLGQQYQAAQRTAILSTQLGLEKMQQTPPLRMLVNPRSFSVSGEKISTDGNWGRNGPIIEHWGDGQDKISGSGSLAGFYSLVRPGPNGPGLGRSARSFSVSYQNFMSLYLLYRNNAGLYMADPTQPDNRPNLSLVGSVYLYYDAILYIGSFDSFTISEDDSKPFSLEYTFEFTVRAAFLLDRPTEQGFGYGMPAISPQSGSPPPSLPTQQTVLTQPVTASAGTIQPTTRTKEEIDADRARLRQKFEEGSITWDEYEFHMATLAHEESPQTPGNEPGAVLRRNREAAARNQREADIMAEMQRLYNQFVQKQIPAEYYFKRRGELQHDLYQVQQESVDAGG